MRAWEKAKVGLRSVLDQPFPSQGGKEGGPSKEDLGLVGLKGWGLFLVDAGAKSKYRKVVTDASSSHGVSA